MSPYSKTCNPFLAIIFGSVLLNIHSICVTNCPKRQIVLEQFPPKGERNEPTHHQLLDRPVQLVVDIDSTLCSSAPQPLSACSLLAPSSHITLCLVVLATVCSQPRAMLVFPSSAFTVKRSESGETAELRWCNGLWRAGV